MGPIHCALHHILCIALNQDEAVVVENSAKLVWVVLLIF